MKAKHGVLISRMAGYTGLKTLVKAKHTIFFTLFLMLTLISIAGMASAHSAPFEEKRFTTLFSYGHVGNYDYVAKLKPNLLYENRSTLRPGEGTLYIRMIENIDIDFSYRFSCDRQADIETEFNSISMDIEAPEMWVKHLENVYENSAGGVGELSAEFSIGVAWLEELTGTIQGETGTSSSTYIIRIKPKIHTVAETGVGRVDENFTPELVVSFNYRGARGDNITISGLENESSGTIRRTETIYHDEVLDQRRASYLMFVIAFTGLIYMTFVLMKTRPVKPEKPLEEVIAPFEEMIMEVAEEPAYSRLTTTVAIKSLEDLANLAGGLGKPIFHLEKQPRAPGAKPTHVFYVLDGLTRYEYSLER